ncbi:hypothetical protein ACHAWF_008145, partial [Thalassiosira exigua]
AVSFDDVDVDDSLEGTRTAGFVVRVVLDELERGGSLGCGINAGRDEGCRSFMDEFQRLVEDSRVPQIDKMAQETMQRLRRKVAARRWRRAISAVRLIVRLRKSESRASIDRDALRGGKWRPGHDMHTARAREPSPASDADGDIARKASDGPTRYFREGSIMHNLIESGIEVVRFGDPHPDDVVYGICCSRRHRRVTVVFRGTTTPHNWLMNMKCAMTDHPNPIAENYPCRSERLGLHTGFALYMLRRRRDDGSTKLEEILAAVESVGRALAPDGEYELSVAGHSLGGALATIFSFYAAASDLHSRAKTVRVFTFAAPCVGCHRFVDAFKHLERSGRLRLARFSNAHDIVPTVPFLSINGYEVRRYRHVGMHVRLHGVHKLAQHRLRRALDVTYPNRSFWSKLHQDLSGSLVMNLNTIQGA